MTSLAAPESSSVLSAVLLADSFAQDFAPITLERPKVLLPLVNVPMMDYTLEWLAASEVSEVFVVCCAHAEQIEAHLKAANWTQKKSIKITILIAAQCLSPGEALRLVDQKDVVKNDFILVTGDVVSSFDLKAAVATHKQRRAADRLAIMTLVMQGMRNTNHRTWAGETETLVVLDPQTNRLLRSEDMDSSKGRKQTILDAEFFSGRDNLMLRTDLLDLHVYICAPEVLLLFSDNFDYQNVERDFISGVLSEEELGNTLHVHAIEDGFACQVRNLRSYDAVSRAILQRWSFPFALDNGLLHETQPEPRYSVKRQNCYREHDVKLARTAVIGRDSVLGAGTSVDENSHVASSVIGRNCHIGKGVQIHGCYIHNNVSIGDGAQLQSALICDGAVILSQATLHAGCIVSYKVVIAAGHEVPSHTLISLCQGQDHRDGALDDDAEYSSAGQIAGSPAATSASTSTQDGAQGSRQLPKAAVKTAAQALAQGQHPSVHVEFDEESVGPGGAGFAWPNHSAADQQATSSTSVLPSHTHGSDVSDSEQESVHERDHDQAEAASFDQEAMFKKEVSETFLRCVKMGYEQDLAVIELNGLKIAEDRTFADCARHVFASILDLCLPPPSNCKAEYQSLFQQTAPDTDTQAGRAELLQRLGAQLKQWAPLLQRFLKSEDEQVELLLTLEEVCEESKHGHAQSNGFEAVFQQVLKLLYDMDILEEDAVLTWADEKQMASEEDRKYLKKAAAFVSWLQQAEAEGSTTDESD